MSICPRYNVCMRYANRIESGSLTASKNVRDKTKLFLYYADMIS